MRSHAHQRTSHRSPPSRHRPRAAARHRRAGDGAVDRRPRQRSGGRDGVPDHPRLPHPQPLRDRREQRRFAGSTASPASTSASTCSPATRRRRWAASSAAAACPRARWPRSRTSSASARARAGSASPASPPTWPRPWPADGKKVGVLDADVWGYSQPRMLGVGAERPKVNDERKLIPITAHDGITRDVDRLLRRAGRRRRVARPDAPQGPPAVPGGRRLGRARLPAHRPAARHRRRLDDAGPAAAAGQVRDRHHAAAGGPEGRRPLGRDGGQAQARDRRRDREHVGLRHPRRRALPDLRRGRRSAAGRASSTCRCWPRSR